MSEGKKIVVFVKKGPAFQQKLPKRPRKRDWLDRFIKKLKSMFVRREK